MASTTESSAIVRFIHGAQPPILERQHSIETEVVANPYFEPVGGPAVAERPARRSYLPLLLLVFAAAAVIAALLIYWAERAPATAMAGGNAPVAVTPAPELSPAVIPVAPEPEPIVIAVPSEPEAESPEAADDVSEPAPVVVASADSAPRLLRRAEREARPGKRVAAAARHGKARRRTEAPALNSNKGVLMIASKPPCYIIIDGKETGLTTPQSLIRLKSGRHELTLVNHDHDIRASIPVIIRAGKSVRVVKDLTDQMKRDVP